MDVRLRLTALISAAIIGGALLACKLPGSASDDRPGVVRYGTGESTVSGVAYLASPVGALTAADPASTVLETVPAGTQVRRVAERGEFVLVEWDAKAGKAQGWVPKQVTAAVVIDTRAGVPEEPGATPKPAAPPVAIVKPLAASVTDAGGGWRAVPLPTALPSARPWQAAVKPVETSKPWQATPTATVAPAGSEKPPWRPAPPVAIAPTTTTKPGWQPAPPVAVKPSEAQKPDSGAKQW